MGRPLHTDRRIAVANHAVARLRGRGNTYCMEDEAARCVIAKAYFTAVESDQLTSHHVPGQQRFAFHHRGVDGTLRALVGIVGCDRTGWSTTGRAVVTVMTVEQVADMDRAQAAMAEASQAEGI